MASAGVTTASVRAEQAVIGAALQTDAALAVILQGGLTADDFSIGSHRAIFAAIVEVHARGERADVLTVVDQLEKADALLAAGGMAGVDAHTGSVPLLANAGRYARMVRESAHVQRFQAAAAICAAEPGDPEARARVVALAGDAPTFTASFVSLSTYLAKPRELDTPYVSSDATILLASGTNLGIAGPTGKGKSLAALRLCGLLADPDGGQWLGLDVRGGLRVVIVALEGSDQDTAQRIRSLVAERARPNITILDRWAPGDHNSSLLEATAAACKSHGADVALLDTLSAFSEGRHDTRYGLTEAAGADLDILRRLSQRDLALILPGHTRKADRNSKTLDEAEEIGGAIAKKFDAAITIRPDSEDGPRRQIRFAKVRTGPGLPSKIATFPTDQGAPPILELVGDLGGRPVTEGTDAEAMAAWIRSHAQPVTASVLRAKFDISETTLRDRRRRQLEDFHISRDRLPGTGNTQAYGTDEQWLTLLSTNRPADQPCGGTDVPAGQNPNAHQDFQPTAPADPPQPPGGAENPENTGEAPTNRPTVPYGDHPHAAGWTPTAASQEEEAAYERALLLHGNPN